MVGDALGQYAARLRKTLASRDDLGVFPSQAHQERKMPRIVIGNFQNGDFPVQRDDLALKKADRFGN